MAPILASLASGLIFGLGLIISQMINPAKVLAFLDIFGAWDLSLAFVMGGAVAALAPKPRPAAVDKEGGPMPEDGGFR